MLSWANSVNRHAMKIHLIFLVGLLIRPFHYTLSTLPLAGSYLFLVKEFEPLDYTNPIWIRVFTVLHFMVASLLTHCYLTYLLYILVSSYMVWKGRRYYFPLFIPVADILFLVGPPWISKILMCAFLVNLPRVW